MKKLILTAVSVFVATQAQAVSLLNNEYGSIDMTGRAYAGHVFGDDRKSELYGSSTFMRMGLKGRTKVDDKNYAIGVYEGQLNVGDKASSTTVPTSDTEKNDSVATRLAYGGINNSDLGTLTFGRQNGAAALVTSWTDVALTEGYGNQGLGVGVDKFATKRATDVLKYSGAFGNFSIDADYKFRNLQDTCEDGTCTSGASETVKDKNNAAYGTAVAYKLSPVVSAGATYTVGKQGSADDASLWTTGVRYDDKALYAAFAYGKGNNWLSNSAATKFFDHTGYEAALGYSFLSGVGLMSTWNKQTAENSSGQKADTVDYMTLGTNYKFNRRFSVMAEYRINQKNADAGSFVGGVKDPVTGLYVDAANDFQLAMKYEF